jgi:hypothetical protein
MFAQRRNRLTTHFSERIPVVKRRISIYFPRLCKNISWRAESHWAVRLFGLKGRLFAQLSHLRTQISISPSFAVTNLILGEPREQDVSFRCYLMSRCDWWRSQRNDGVGWRILNLVWSYNIKSRRTSVWVANLQGYWRVFSCEGNLNMLANDAGFLSIHRWRLWIIVRSIDCKSDGPSWARSAELLAAVCQHRARWITLKYYRRSQTKEMPSTAAYIQEALFVQHLSRSLCQMIYLMMMTYIYIYIYICVHI